MSCSDAIPEATHRTIGSVLRDMRGDLSVHQAADRAGVDPTTWWRIERGDIARPTTVTLLAISEAFGVPVTDLINPSGPNPAKRRAAKTTQGA